jgi:hypothetical protein
MSRRRRGISKARAKAQRTHEIKFDRWDAEQVAQAQRAHERWKAQVTKELHSR